MVTNGHNAVSPSCPPNAIVNQQQVQQQGQTGHHRTSSAPPGATPPGGQPQQQQIPAASLPVQQSTIPPAPACPAGLMNYGQPQYAQQQQQQQTHVGSGVVVGIGSLYGTTVSGGQQQQQQPQQLSQQPYEYCRGGGQYGSRASLNSQYSGSSQNGVGMQAAVQAQYSPAQVAYVQQQQQQQQPPLAGSPVMPHNPYGTPTNSVNQQYNGPECNLYAPVTSVSNAVGGQQQQQQQQQPPPPPQQQQQQQSVVPPPPPVAPVMPQQTPIVAAPPPPPPPPSSMPGLDGPPHAPDVNSLAAALQAAKLKRKQVIFISLTVLLNDRWLETYNN